jgi:2-amino-4-hydroxy-6-hydroxymethyldihydropteridine diphosphokinase
MAATFLLLGSNLGNRQLFLQQAIIQIEAQIAPVTKTSSIYETQSWGVTDAPDYLNMVVVLQTNLPPRALLEILLHIEHELGRERRERWGARVIDIDILFYGDDIIDEPGLQIPHPRLHERRFTLEPLAELAPELIHPVLKHNIATLKTELKDSLVVKKL